MCYLSNPIYEDDIIAAETKTDVMHTLHKIVIGQWSDNKFSSRLQPLKWLAKFI